MPIFFWFLSDIHYFKVVQGHQILWILSPDPYSAPRPTDNVVPPYKPSSQTLTTMDNATADVS